MKEQATKEQVDEAKKLLWKQYHNGSISMRELEERLGDLDKIDTFCVLPKETDNPNWAHRYINSCGQTGIGRRL